METDTGYLDDALCGQGDTHTHTHGLMKSLVCVAVDDDDDRCVCVSAGVVEGRAEERTARTDRCR